MKCVMCGGNTTCKDSRPAKMGGYPITRRRLACTECKFRFTTYELSDGQMTSIIEAEKEKIRTEIGILLELIIRKINSVGVGIKSGEQANENIISGDSQVGRQQDAICEGGV